MMELPAARCAVDRVNPNHPILSGTTTRPSDPALGGPGPGLPRPEGPCHRVYVLERSPMLRALLSLALEPTRCVPVMVSDAGQLLARSLSAQERGRSPLALLIDCSDRCGGLTSLRDLRRMGYRGRIVAMTDRRDPVHHLRAIDAGADECVGKPFSPVELLRAVYGTAAAA